MATLGGFGAAQPTTGGFNFGSGAAPAKPIGIGTTQANTTTSSSGGLLGGLLASTTTSATPSTGFSLGAATTTSTATGLGGGFSFSTPASSTTTANTGFGFGTPGAAAATTTSAANTGFGFGAQAAPAATTTSTGFGFGTSTTSTSSGLTLGAPSTTSAPSTGFASTGFSLGGSSLAGLGSTGTTTTTSTTLGRGLGGVNPAATTSNASTANANKAGGADPKASSKETQIPQPVAQTVDDFQKYVKQQKCVRENIARLSCKNLYKVQEEVGSLKQALSLVSNGLQRNAVAISKLKLQAAQELKYAEIAQRTKDTPPGLQYENTAPTEYFQHMVVAFEQQMVTYRQQIEQMETYLSSLHHNAMLTPHELSMLLNKLLSSFVSLAAQLQSVHEQVNAQKEHYLNYRKVFHGESTDIFDDRRGGVAQRTVSTSSIPATIPMGPTPFHIANSPVAAAMAAALNKTGHRPPVHAGHPGGSLGFNVGTGGGGLFSNPAQNTSAPKPLGFGASSNNPFGSTTTTGFGQQPTATVRPLGVSTDAPQPALGANSATPFQLQKPPIGNKRNKKS